MKNIEPSRKQKLITFACLGSGFWGIVAWLFLGRPLFVIEILPDPIPLSVFTFLVFLIGLLFLTLVCTTTVRTIAPRYKWVVILASATLIVAYNLSSMAPVWKCFGNRVYVKFANAAGQNCTTTCTNNKKKPCSGWSSCWDKNVSCSSAGRDQDGRGCNGCCFSCVVECEDDDPPPSYQPPTVNGSVACSQAGNNGWCIGTSTLNLSASDPQGFATTISGTINGTAFTCPGGNSCSQTLPEGNASITYKATAATSGLSSSPGSTTWKRDVTVPAVNAVYPSANGSNGWHITSPVAVSASGSDAMSGLVSALVSVNGGAWQPSVSLIDGVYAVDFQTVDNAGNPTTVSRTIQVDATPPSVSPLVPSPDGLNDWFVTAPVNISADGSDSGSGLASALVSVDGEAWQPNASLTDGVYTVDFRSVDNAGNIATETRTVKVDSVAPSLSASMSGTAGLSGWYVSQVTTTISSSDSTSGVDRIEFNQNNAGWQNGSSVVSNDGINTIDARAYDVAGNMSSDSLQIKVDTVLPSLSTSISGTAGLSGWYTSQTATTISTRDETSGVDRVEYNQNNTGWQSGSSVVSTDGINTIDTRVYDVAGNMSSKSLEIKVDTVRPTSKFNSPANASTDTLVRGTYTLAGVSADTLSGVSGAEISLDGKSWLPLEISSEDTWSYTLNTLSLPDGVYPIVVRTTDNAGNTELLESGARVTLLVNNTPPHIKLTPEWLIWESGSLLIKTDYFPVAEGTIVISDPKKRWPEVRIPFGKKYPSTITWDRRFADRTLAPIGNYRVTVEACNTYNLCSNKTAIIKIPWISIIVPTVSPAPPTVVPESPAVEKPAVENIPERPATEIPRVVVVEDSLPQPTVHNSEEPKPVGIALWLVAFVALMWALASAALSDRRPTAINAITRTIQYEQNI